MSAPNAPKTPSLQIDEARKIARLARLQFSDEDLHAMAQSMSSILTLMAVLDEVDTDQVEPLFNPLDQVQSLRSDVITETLQKDDLQAIAPDSANGYYQVPRVID